MIRFLVTLIVAAVYSCWTQQAEAATTKRFALLIGANNGGKDRVQLRYAVTDAEAMDKVLGQLGGVLSTNKRLLKEPARAEISGAISAIQSQMAAAKQNNERSEFLFYYSGHSDEEGLLLGNERLSYEELRQALRAVTAEVRVAILDSCSSGALVRRKGGQRIPAFLLDQSSQVRGHAFITSSSANEAAQESDRVGASFFTHYLISGLRGAADASHDGKVTLNEAYHYAFNETLSRTERTQSGPQHPNYDIDLAGSGDLVVTDLRDHVALLQFSDDFAGRIFVRDSNDRLVAELRKDKGLPVDLALEPNTYRVSLDTGTTLSVVEATLRPNQRLALGPEAMRPVSKEMTVARGVEERPDQTVSAMSAALIPEVSTYGPDDQGEHVVSLNLLKGRIASLRGLELGLGVNHVVRRAKGAQLTLVCNVVDEALLGVQVAFIGNVVQGTSRGAQLSVGFNYAEQAFAGAQLGFLFNVSTAQHEGIQAAATVNYAAQLSGIQVALINIADEVNGLQLGVINIARKMNGFQLGAINIAQELDGASFGPLSYAHNVPLRFQFWASESQLINGTFRYGSQHLYWLVNAGVQPFKEGQATRGSFGTGFGVHIPIEEAFINFDLALNWALFGGGKFGTANLWPQAKLYAGWQISPRFSVFVGASYNVFITGNQERTRDESTLGFMRKNASGFDVGTNAHGYHWPGFFGGIQI